MAFLVILVIVGSGDTFLEYPGVLRDPYMTPFGIIMTDAHYTRLYVYRNDSLAELVSTPGCGRYFTLSADCTLIGYKTIFENGLQSPSLVDIRTGERTILHAPGKRAGQVSFSDDGIVAYTSDHILIVVTEGRKEYHDLGGYANYTSISPDGSMVVYNDQDDQLWVLGLRSGERFCISDNRSYGYCLPQWSRNSRFILYSRLDRYLYIYDIMTHTTHRLPQGFHATWSFDNEHIIYYVPIVDHYQVTGSDLYRVRYDGSGITRMVNSISGFEIDPRFYAQDSLIFCAGDSNTVFIAQTRNDSITGVKRIGHWNGSFDRPVHQVTGPAGRDSLDVPYLNQVYDTPDWFNGHWACAPSTAMMAIAYYSKLPVWSCWCSSPYGHTHDFGRYVCERYWYREVDYTWQAQDPSGNWAIGGYGYMWSGTNRPYTHMAPYLENHDIVSWRDDSPTFNEAVGEINAGYLYGMCVGLTTSGHLVLAVGQVLDWHTLIFNDPYGNKNTAGYPSYDGKYARYDWPGYNNGYENLNSVYWCVGARGNWEPLSDTIVDDLQFNSGFYLHSESPSSMGYWRDALTGYNGHMWWTYTTASAVLDTCYAVWTPSLSLDGDYEVSVHVPGDHANATSAHYWIHTANDTLINVILDQSLYGNDWVSLGVYPFLTTSAFVRLGDATGIQGQHIGFDAVRWRYQGPGIREHGHQAKVSDLAQCNNPVSGHISMILHCATPGKALVRLYSINGQFIKETVVYIPVQGEHRIMIDVSDCAPGVYFATTVYEGEVDIEKIVIIRD